MWPSHAAGCAGNQVCAAAWNSCAGSISAMRTLTSRRAGFVPSGTRPCLLVFVQESIHKLGCNHGTIRAARENRNPVAVFQFEWLRLQGFAQQSGNYTARSGFALLGDLFDGEKKLIVNIYRGSHSFIILHLMRDDVLSDSRGDSVLTPFCGKIVLPCKPAFPARGRLFFQVPSGESLVFALATLSTLA